MRFPALLFLLTGFALGAPRDEALTLAHQAGQFLESDPAEASKLAAQAFAVLKTDGDPSDLAACAGLAARAARLAGDHLRAQIWFRNALALADPQNATILRAELADMLMRNGELALARESLGPPPQLPPPSPALAQWQQTSAKLHLACGLPEEARLAITAAIAALPADDTANQVALAIDAAGIALRLDLDVTPLIEDARQKLLTLPDPNPQLKTPLTPHAPPPPGPTTEESLALLQSVDLADLPEEARLTFSITLAEAAARTGKRALVSKILASVISSDLLPNDHPLLARALALAADAANDPALAKQSSQVALRWLENSDDSEILLGLQRTVDPLSPLINHALDALPDAALASRNFALRQRLGGEVIPPTRQTVLYLLYQKDFEQHYGALVFNPTPHWIPLGPAEPIHRRISDTIDTAERTLAEAATGARLPTRLTQLWKSLWQPLESQLNPALPIDIAPIGMLDAVPWATLRQRDGHYLCQAYQDIRVLALTGHFPALKPGTEILISGTSSAPEPLANLHEFPFDEQLSGLVGMLPPLPGVKAELAIFDQATHLNQSRQEFIEDLGANPATIHLAGHGFVIESDDGHGFRAGLIFHGGGAENILFARDIANLNLARTGLVVLSACRGGIGQGEVGGNWSSLRRSFIAAGARHVLAAQWQIRDDQIPPFMKAFYQARQAQPDHQALWQLQKQWIEKGTDLDIASAGAWVMECVPSD